MKGFLGRIIALAKVAASRSRGGTFDLRNPCSSVSSLFIWVFNGFNLNLLEARGAEMIQGKGDQIGAGADAEKNGIAGGDVMLVSKMVEQPAGQDWKNEPASRTGHTTKAHDRSHGQFGEHVGNGSEKICRPGLVGGGGQTDEQHCG